MALSAEGAGRPVPSDIRARNVFGGRGRVEIQFTLRGQRNSVYSRTRPAAFSEAFSEENIRNWLVKDK